MSQSARKALDLLTMFAGTAEPLGLIQASTRAGLDKSTASRLLGLLEEMSFIERDPDTRKYDVGPALVTLAASVLSHVDLRGAAHSYLVALRDATEETVTLHVRAGDQRVCIDAVESGHIVRRVVSIGETQPLVAGNTGRVFLAFMSRDEVVEAARRSTIGPVALDKLEPELADIRARGYLLSESKRLAGVTSACVPVAIGRGRLAALAVSGPSDRWSTARAQEFIEYILATARELEAILRTGGARVDAMGIPALED